MWSRFSEAIAFGTILRMPFSGMAPQKKKAITGVMAFTISVGLTPYGRFGLSKASETAKTVTAAVTPIAVTRK